MAAGTPKSESRGTGREFLPRFTAEPWQELAVADGLMGRPALVFRCSCPGLDAEAANRAFNLRISRQGASRSLRVDSPQDTLKPRREETDPAQWGENGGDLKGSERIGVRQPSPAIRRAALAGPANRTPGAVFFLN